MSLSSRVGSTLAFSFAALVVMWGGESHAQSVANNPFHAVHGWEKMPTGWKLGVPSGVFPDPDGKHIWILSRCGANHCAGSDQDVIFKFDLDGNVVKSFGAGLFSFPHGFFLDHEGYVWVTEGAPAGDRREVEGLKRGLGHQVFKLNQEGEVVMTLGQAGVSRGMDRTTSTGRPALWLPPTGTSGSPTGIAVETTALSSFRKTGSSS